MRIGQTKCRGGETKKNKRMLTIRENEKELRGDEKLDKKDSDESNIEGDKHFSKYASE